MKRKSIVLFFVTAAIVGALLTLEWNQVKEKPAESIHSVIPAQIQKYFLNTDEKKKEVLSSAQEVIKENIVMQSNEDIEAQIDEIDRILESANAVEKMNSEDLDDQTRREFMELLEARQKLLTTLVDRELKVASELLAGAK